MSPRFGPAKALLLAAAASISLAAPQLAAAQSDDPSAYNSQTPAPPQGYQDPCAQSQTNRSVVGGVLGGLAGAAIGNSVAHGGGKLGGTLIGGAAGAAAGAGIGHASASCNQGQTYASAQPDDYGPPPQAPAPGSSPPPDDRYRDQQDQPDYGSPPAPPPPGSYVPPDDSRYGSQRGQSDYGQPPAPPSSSAYPPDDRYPQQDDRYAGQGDRYPEQDDRSGYGSPPPATGQCQMVRDRIYFPDGTTESRTVQACLDSHGRWRVVD